MDLRSDHAPLPDAAATRRYFAKFERIIGHLRQVHALTPDARDADAEVRVAVIEGYLTRLARTFEALACKHLMAKHVSGALPHELEIDRTDSGFPVHRELLQMANDLAQAPQRLQDLPPPDVLKRAMVRHILRDRTPPRQLQFAMSQRIYVQALAEGEIFLAQTPAEAVPLAGERPGRRRYLVHWAVFDSLENLPMIYLMVVDDTGDTPLPQDARRWPRARSHLLAQSNSSLKIVTIASGFDRDFEDLHPKQLRRIHVGPMYSHAYTEQKGPLRDILAEAAGKPGLDWALAWTVESLVSKETSWRHRGLFGTVEHEVYALDHFALGAHDAGASAVDRALILPQRPYQVLVDRDPPGLRGVRKFVVGDNGEVFTYA